MKTNSSLLFQTYFLSITGVIVLFTTLLPNQVVGATCSSDLHWLKQQTEEARDANDIAARFAKIRRASDLESTGRTEIVEVTDRDLTLAYIAKVEIVKGNETEVIIDQTGGTLPQVLKNTGDFRVVSERAFKNYVKTITGYDIQEVTDIKIRVIKDGEVLLTVEVMQEGGVLFKFLNEDAYNSFNSINWENVEWTNSAEALFKSAEEARNQESTYRQQEENNRSFENIFTSPEHILLALATRQRDERFSDFHNLFNNLTNRPTGMQRLGELTLGLVSNRFSAQTRRSREVTQALYRSTNNIRPEDRKNGVDKTEYPSNIERSAFFETEQQTTKTLPKERTVSNTTNLNEKVETDYTLTEGVKGRIQELVTAISHKGILEIFGEPFSGRRTIVSILADLVNATRDPSHRYHKEALELISESLRDISIHMLEGSIHAGTKYRGEDTEKFQNLVTELSSYEGRAILFTSDVNLLLRNTNTDSHQTATGASNLIGVLREPIKDEEIILIFITNRTQQTQVAREDMFLNRQTINIPTLTQQEILEYIKPLAENKNSVNAEELFTPEQLTILIDRTIYIAQQYPTLTGVGITGAKKLLNAVFDNTKIEDPQNIKNNTDVRYHVDRITSQVFANGVMDIGMYSQIQLEHSKIKEDIERSFIPPNQDMLNTFISRMIHTTSRIAPHVEVLLGPPGTGKTTFAEALGSAFNREVVVIEGSKLTVETIIGDGPTSIVSKIRAAKGPIIIYINEANLVVSSVFETNSPVTHLEKLLEKGEIIDIHGNKVYAQTHTFLLDMNLNDANAGKFNKWREENPKATTTEINTQLADLIKEELKARLAFMSRIINEENIHRFRHLDKEAMKKIITLKVEDKKDQLLEETGLLIKFEKDAIELLAEHAISNEGMRDYGARPILNRIDLIINVLKAELTASLETARIPEDTEIQITENNGQLFITIKTREGIIVEGHYDLNEGGFFRLSSNNQQPESSDNEAPNARFNFFNRR